MEVNSIRICKKCKEEKTIDNFYKVRKESKYYRSICKPCALKEKLEWKKTEKGREAARRYNSTHKEQKREWNRNHKKIYGNSSSKKWKLEHPEEWRLSRLKTKTKRKRELGFIPINKKFPGSVAHHLDNNYVIYIPEELHRKFYHPNRELHRLLVLNELFIQGIIL